MPNRRLCKTQKGGRKRKSRRSKHTARKHVKKQTRGRKIKKRRKTRRNYHPSSTSLRNFLAAFS